MKILLLSDIHANYTALRAIMKKFSDISFDHIIHCGDSIVYGPYPDETLAWLRKHKVHSILGNTDRKVIKLLKGKTFKKPGKAEKRIMYTWTAEQLKHSSKKYLLSLKKHITIPLAKHTVCLFHGSPAHPNEFLFPDTPKLRFQELARDCPCNIIITGHSHTPYHLEIESTHFINPGSVGRMFDGNPDSSCAILTLTGSNIDVEHHRVPYHVERTCKALADAKLPSIYQKMYRAGKKLN